MGIFLDLQQFADDTNQRMDDVVRETVILAAQGVVMGSPVGNPELWAANAAAVAHNTAVSAQNAVSRSDPANLTKAGRLKKGIKNRSSKSLISGKGYVGGRFRNNWQVGIGVIDTATSDEVDPAGSATIARIASEVVGLKAGGVVNITNSLPYARRLEEGYSTQAPTGMVRITVIDLPARISALVKGRK